MDRGAWEATVHGITSWTQLNIKRNKVLVHTTTWINLKKYGKRNKPSTNVHILYDSLCIESPE